MKSAFIVQGYSPDLTFIDPSFHPLRESMLAESILLRGVPGGWKEHSLRSFGELAVEQTKDYPYDGLILAHSLGALAVLGVIDKIQAHHLILCSPSALFSEDIQASKNPRLYQRMGERLIRELGDFSAKDAVSAVNNQQLPTTILFGEKEQELYPDLVTRCHLLAADINDAELVEVEGAAHFVGEKRYSNALTRVVSGIFSDL